MALTAATSPIKAYGNGQVIIAGNFTGTNGAVGAVEGKGVTASYVGEGVYLLTLPGKGAINILSAQLTVQVASDQDAIAVISDRDDSARTVEVTVFQEAATDMTPADILAGEFVHFLFILKNTGLPY